MAKRSPQARYQAALRVIKQRTKVPHKLAQQIYRDGRDAGLSVKFPTTWKKLDRERLTIFVAGGRFAIQTDLFSGRSFGWDLRDSGEVTNVKDAGTYAEMTIQVQIYHGGIFQGIKTVTRKSVPVDEFWETYHDMVRDAVDGAYEEGGTDVSAVTISVAAL